MDTDEIRTSPESQEARGLTPDEQRAERERESRETDETAFERAEEREEAEREEAEEALERDPLPPAKDD